MKMIKKIEDFKLTRRLPSCRVHIEDLKKLDNKMRRQIQQHEKIFETEKDEEIKSKIEFHIESAGIYDGIKWDRKKKDIDEFFSSEIMGNKLTYAVFGWEYYLGAAKKDDIIYVPEINSVLSRNITLVFSNDRCNVRILGESSDWINDLRGSEPGREPE